MKLPFSIVDAFVVPDKPAFSGNPAAVILLPTDDTISDNDKQKIANEFNLSETVYVSRSKSKDSQFVIRWFTPSNEVSLCGHATVAASYVLYNENHIFSDIVDKSKSLNFRTNFNSHVQSSYQDGNIVLNFPLNDCTKLDETANPWISGLKQALVGESQLNAIVDVQYSPTTKKLIVRLRDDANNLLLQLTPDFNKLLNTDTNDLVRGLIVTQKTNFADDGIHFRSRYFAPWVGVSEDPVTGSAHTVLAPYWSKVYRVENGQVITDLFAKQVSKARTGLLECRIDGDRVLIKGKARLFSKGTVEDF